MSPPIVLILTTWPEWESSAAGVRDQGIIQTLLEADQPIVAISPARHSEKSQRLTKLGIPTHHCLPNSDQFDELIQSLQPSHCIFDRFIMEEQFGWRVRRAVPACFRVVDMQDFHWLRAKRELAFKHESRIQVHKNVDFSRNDPLLFRELASYLRSDWVWAISREERNLLSQLMPQLHDKTSIVSYFYEATSGLPDFHERSGFCWIGNFRHPPNLASFRWLRDHVWNQVRSLDQQAEIFIYGAYPTSEVMAAHRPDEGFYVIGPVKDCHEALKKHRILLAPIPFGAGIKGKVCDAFHAGCPVVTTSIGAEGVSNLEAFGGMVADDEAEMVRSALHLYCQADAWKTAQRNGFNELQSFHSKEISQKAIHQSFEELRCRGTQKGEEDILMNLLWSQRFRATEYFSRWIQAKEQQLDFRNSQSL